MLWTIQMVALKFTRPDEGEEEHKTLPWPLNFPKEQDEMGYWKW